MEDDLKLSPCICFVIRPYKILILNCSVVSRKCSWNNLLFSCLHINVVNKLSVMDQKNYCHTRPILKLKLSLRSCKLQIARQARSGIIISMVHIFAVPPPLFKSRSPTLLLAITQEPLIGSCPNFSQIQRKPLRIEGILQLKMTFHGR